MAEPLATRESPSANQGERLVSEELLGNSARTVSILPDPRDFFMVLDHFTLASNHPEASGHFIADVLGLRFSGLDHRGFASVEVSEVLHILCVPDDHPAAIHLALHVDIDVVERAKSKLASLGVLFGSSPDDPTNGRDDHPFGGKGIHFQDLDGHFWEIMTNRSM